MLNHRLQVDDSFPIRTHQPSGTETALGGNRLRRRARVGAGSSTTTGTPSVQPPSAKTPPGAYADRLGVPPGSPHLPRSPTLPYTG